MPIFRKRSSFSVPTIGMGGVVFVALILLAVGAVVVLSIVDIRPPLRTIEQEIPSERFSR